MTAVLLLNLILALAVLGTILVLVAWAIMHSHHEGRPVAVASRRQWRRHTVRLHGSPDRASRMVRPFALDSD
jgi:hypothetical protein